MNIYGIPNCDTMKKAFDWLKKNKVSYTFHNYKEVGISKPKLEEWLKQVPLATLINTKSTTFKNLGAEAQQALTSKTKAIRLMMENTSVIKRPVLETGEKILTGFKEEEWEKLL